MLGDHAVRDSDNDMDGSRAIDLVTAAYDGRADTVGTAGETSGPDIDTGQDSGDTTHGT